jgi:hypothetical protein
VSNSGTAEVEAGCTFRTAGRMPELWHPESGEIRPLPSYRPSDDGRTVVPLRFGPEESYFVMFRSRGSAPPGANFPRAKLLSEIQGPWQVSFDARWGGPEAAVRFVKLDDWTARAEPGIRYYSGSAMYRTTFAASTAAAVPARCWLDLGTVHELAQVRLNGKDLGIAWRRPFRVEASGALQEGVNELEVRVTNLWANRMIGDERLPADSIRGADGNLKSWPRWLLEGKPSPQGRYTFSPVRPWRSNDQPLPSGLLGPVRLEGPAEK